MLGGRLARLPGKRRLCISARGYCAGKADRNGRKHTPGYNRKHQLPLNDDDITHST